MRARARELTHARIRIHTHMYSPPNHTNKSSIILRLHVDGVEQELPACITCARNSEVPEKTLPSGNLIFNFLHVMLICHYVFGSHTYVQKRIHTGMHVSVYYICVCMCVLILTYTDECLSPLPKSPFSQVQMNAGCVQMRLIIQFAQSPRLRYIPLAMYIISVPPPTSFSLYVSAFVDRSIYLLVYFSLPPLCLPWSIAFIYMHRNIYYNAYVYTHAGSSRVYGMLREHRRSRNKSCRCVEARGGGRGTLC